MALAAIFLSNAALSAQTPEEIVEKMMAQMDRGNVEGFSMDLNMKMPIVGTIRSHNSVSGDRLKSEVRSKEKNSIVWSDATTKWTLNPATREVTIENKSASDSGNYGVKSFDNLAEGYKLTLKKETEEAWYIVCKKRSSNKNKDDAKKMELTVSKDTYLPICLSTKTLLVSVSIENYALGVTEESVTFDPAAYPGVILIDKR